MLRLCAAQPLARVRGQTMSYQAQRPKPEGPDDRGPDQLRYRHRRIVPLRSVLIHDRSAFAAVRRFRGR